MLIFLNRIGGRSGREVSFGEEEFLDVFVWVG